jgi:hypothetical protein
VRSRAAELLWSGGEAVCDSARRLVPDAGAAREWLRAADSTKVASVVVVMGSRAARAYELHGGEVGAVVITTRRSPNESLPPDPRVDRGSPPRSRPGERSGHAASSHLVGHSAGSSTLG